MELGIFQTLVRRWCVRAFGQEVADNHRERNHRFLEEALELGQSLGCSQEDAHVLVDYVYGRPKGTPGQEVGGVLVTLAALCGAHASLSMDSEAKIELARINRPEILEKIRGKQAAKQRDIPLSPLPGKPQPPPLRDLHDNQQAPPALEIALDTKDLVSGRTFEEIHCEICGAQESRIEGVRCPTHRVRTHTDAVGTTGGKATVARPI